MKVGYARVSTTEQNEERQVLWLRDEIKVSKLFVDKASGKNTDRPEFKKMMEFVREGDELYIESISRLSRSIRDLLKTVDELESKGVKLISAKESFSTGNPQGRLVLQLFGSLGEYERQTILQRQREGIQIAKQQGKYRGRKPKHIDDPELFKKLYKKWRVDKSITAREFMRRIDLLPNTFYRIIKKYEETGEIN